MYHAYFVGFVQNITSLIKNKCFFGSCELNQVTHLYETEYSMIVFRTEDSFSWKCHILQKESIATYFMNVQSWEDTCKPIM